jgi:NADH-quinone oxidoreductase subunit E
MVEKLLNKEGLFPLLVQIELNKWLSRYNSNQKRSIIIPALHILQDYNGGYLTTDLLDRLALYLSIKAIWIYEVVKFYTMFSLKPTGCHRIDVCDNVVCLLNGARDIISCIQDKLRIKVGQTTRDSNITLRTVECQASCCSAPVLLVDKVFFSNVTVNKVINIVKSLE